jgi:hypothetical protein
MPPLAPLALSTGFAAKPLRGHGGFRVPSLSSEWATLSWRNVEPLFSGSHALPWTRPFPTFKPQLPSNSYKPPRFQEPLEALSLCSPCPLSLSPVGPGSPPSGTARARPPARLR